jgi:hypothetical protein
MKLEAKTLAVLVSSLLTSRARRVRPCPGIEYPVPFLVLVAVLMLIPGHDGVARADLLDGLQLHVEFENNVVDSSSNGFDGQAIGDLQYAAGVIGQAAMFDGVNDQVLFPTFSDALITVNDFSISYWFNTPSGSLLSVLGKREICAASLFYDIRMNANRSMGLEVNDGVTSFVVSSGDTTPGWHHVAFTRSGTDFQAFLDGELVDQNVSPATLDFSNTATLGLSNSPCIGADGTVMLEGGIDELRVYDRLLTDFEIVNLGGIFADGFETGDTSEWSSTVP